MTGFSPPSPRMVARAALIGLAIVVVIGLISAAGSALAPFVVGLVLAYLLTPIVNRLDRWMPRWMAILFVYAVILVIFAGILIFLAPPLINQTIRLVVRFTRPDALERLVTDIVNWYYATVPREFQSPLEQIVRNSLPVVQENLSTIVSAAGAFLLSQMRQIFGVLSFLIGFLILPIWLFYVLHDSRKARIFVNRQLDYRIRPDFWNVWGIVDRSLSAYIRGQLTLGLIVGVGVGVSLTIVDFIPGIDVDYILPLALWAGVAELVPMIGAMLGAVPAVIVTLFVGGPLSALVVVVVFTIVQLVENNFLVPRVIGESVGVHPAILIVVLVVFGALFGLPGVILAAPATAAARDLYLYAYRRISGKSPAEAMALVPHLTKPLKQPHGQREATQAAQDQRPA
ncbi:MAG: AI-2E family transporter [Anaerolineae bacterium]|nr:AI-2E family transporter [Anaerolineae bacterium]